MGGTDLGVLYEQLKEHLQSLHPLDSQQDQQQLARDVQALRNDYPGFMFTVVAGGGQTGIEAVPKPGYEGELVAIIMPDANGLREALDAALDDPVL
jgi:hypothetical protein